ncbi:hypothetical protein COV19_06045 [Candidatus Woesearchaeota archaeon CG10_big_fil_rev_8_21_14_0_10_44_13]|nr:MAG: hypothetical protein COV19_06045 [Candidatus Woesearchaeota archaeon CG10_big_fil_rev_8_21_14_0_10_44_13]
MKRIDDKITQIHGFISQLKDIVPSEIEEYRSSIEKRAACERYVEKIVEAAVDLAFMAIKAKRFEIPEDDADAFNILSNHNFINEGLAKRLKAAKGMRNLIVHEYGRIDDDKVFHSITQELEKDVDEFLKEVKKST